MDVFSNRVLSQPDFLAEQPVTEGWLTEDIHSDADSYFQGLLKDIDQAQQCIDFAVYIFSLDKIGDRIAEALCAAACRGVRVRLMIDGVGSADDGYTLADKLTKAGAEVKIYHPLPWSSGAYRWPIPSGGFIEKCGYLLASLNRRDHRKFCAVDHSIAWCGSFNVTEDHLDYADPWRDYAVRLTGSPVVNLVENFESVWFQRDQLITSRLLQYFRSNTSRRLRRLRNRLLVHRIRHAEQRVWICNAYFAPSWAVIKAIAAARKRGVEVRLVVAGRSDVRLFPMLSSTYYADLIKLGVDIYSYQAGILHAKVILIDQTCVIGSTNLNHRSFYHDLELDVVIYSSESIASMKKLLQQDMAASLIILKDETSYWRGTDLFGWLLRLIRYWM